MAKKKSTVTAHREKMSELHGYIQGNLDDDLSLDALAERVGMSRFHLHRIYKEVMGRTLGEAVRVMRLDRARADLIEGRLSLKEIATKAGYTTIGAFGRAFREEWGMPPISWIARHSDMGGGVPELSNVTWRVEQTDELAFATPDPDVESDAPSSRAVMILSDRDGGTCLLEAVPCQGRKRAPEGAILVDAGRNLVVSWRTRLSRLDEIMSEGKAMIDHGLGGAPQDGAASAVKAFFVIRPAGPAFPGVDAAVNVDLHVPIAPAARPLRVTEAA